MARQELSARSALPSALQTSVRQPAKRQAVASASASEKVICHVSKRTAASGVKAEAAASGGVDTRVRVHSPFGCVRSLTRDRVREAVRQQVRTLRQEKPLLCGVSKGVRDVRNVASDGCGIASGEVVASGYPAASEGSAASGTMLPCSRQVDLGGCVRTLPP